MNQAEERKRKRCVAFTPSDHHIGDFAVVRIRSPVPNGWNEPGVEVSNSLPSLIPECLIPGEELARNQSLAEEVAEGR